MFSYINACNIIRKLFFLNFVCEFRDEKIQLDHYDVKRSLLAIQYNKNNGNTVFIQMKHLTNGPCQANLCLRAFRHDKF